MAEMPEPEALLEHRAFLRAVAKGLLKDDAAAEDVAQETLLAAMERPPQGKNLRGWLGAVARNLSLMTRRGERRRENRERRAARPEAVAPATEALALLELQRKVVDAVRTLDEPYRTAIVLRYFHDLPVRELAARLRVPKETARTRLRRGLGILRTRLDADYGGNRSWAPLLVVLAADPRKASVAGVALMTAKTKIAIAAVVCILLTFLTVKWGGLGGTETPRAEAARPAVVPEPSPEAPLASLPDPADFARVDRDRDLHGIVVDKSGAPIAGADLRAVFHPWRRLQSVRPGDDTGFDGPDTRSATDGTFRLPLERGQDVWLRVSAAGYVAGEIPHLQAGERVRVELAAPGSLVVRVKDEAGGPIGGAMVEIYCYRDFEIRRNARTDSTGAVRFADLPSDTNLHVRAFHPAYGNAHLAADKSARAGGEKEIVLPAGRVLSGRVADAATGAPVPGARVGMIWTMRPETLTDQQGRYRLNGGYEDNVVQDLHVEAEGYVQAAVAVGAKTEYDFALDRGVEVTGRLLAVDNKPVAGAFVAAAGGLQSLYGGDLDATGRAYAESNDEGAFRLAPLRSRAFHTLFVTAPGHGRLLLDFNTGGEAASLGDIVLPVARSIEGVVLDAAGKPVPRVEVQVSGENRDRGRLGVRSNPMNHVGRAEERFTDDLGRFRFPDLSSGVYRLSAEPKGRAFMTRTVVIDDKDVLDVALRLPDTRTFVVRAVDDAGGPIARAAVSVQHDGGTSSAWTDEDGRAELQVTGRIAVVRPPWGIDDAPYSEPEPITDLPETATEASFVLARWEEIRGTVIDEAGAPLAEAILEASWGGKKPKRISTNAHGTFHVAVPPGSVTDLRVAGKYVNGPGGTQTTDPSGLVGERRGIPAGSRDVVVRAAAPRRDATVTVRVLAPDGTPLAGARVSYQRPPPDERVTAETGADGRATLTKLPAAEISVYAFVDAPKLGFVHPQQVTVTPAGQEIEMRCREAVRLKGIVVDPEGKPTSAQVFVRSEGSFHGLTGTDGRFEILVPKEMESADLWAFRPGKDGVTQQGSLKHRLADGEARIVLKPPD